MPEVEDEDDAGRVPAMDDLVLEGVVEDEELAVTPGPVVFENDIGDLWDLLKTRRTPVRRPALESPKTLN